MARSAEKLVITTSTRADGAAYVCVCVLASLGGEKRATGGDYRDRTVGLGAGTSAFETTRMVPKEHSLTLSQAAASRFCNLLFSSKQSLPCYYAGRPELCVVLAQLHVKYRSLVPEFLRHGPGSLRHFIYLTLAACGFPDLFLYLLFHLSDHAVESA